MRASSSLWSGTLPYAWEVISAAADGHRDVHGDHDGHTDNDHNGHRGWIHYRNYGWYAGAVTVRQCFQGSGHINRDRYECAGGRFNGDLVRSGLPQSG